MTDTTPGTGRVLVIVAHPDDVDFGVAGTVALWTDGGAEVIYCVVTDGDAGGFDRQLDRGSMAGIRQGEQRAAGALVGVSDVRFLGYPDGRVVADLDLRRDLARQIRAVRPDRILCPSAERNYRRMQASHPDHLAVGEAALCAIYPDARNPFAFPELLAEGFEPHAVNDIWMMASPHPNHFVDVTSTIDRKVSAILAHHSQLPDPGRTEAMVREMTARNAGENGFEPGSHVESFFVISL